MKHGIWILGLLFACGGPPDTEDQPLVPDVAGARLENIYAVTSSAAGAVTLRVAGLDSALDEPAQVVVDGALHSIEPDPRGRFVFEADGAPSEVRLKKGSAEVVFRVRDPAAARAASVRPTLDAAGSVPNDLLIVGEGPAAFGLLVRSGDNALSVVDLKAGVEAGPGGVRLPSVPSNRGERVANPWFVATVDDTHAAVTAFGQRHVYVIDLEALSIAHTFELSASVQVTPPRTIDPPHDVDGDGVADALVERFVPSTPQGLLVIGRTLHVGFASFIAPRLSAAQPPVYLPAVLAAWDLDHPDAPPSTYVLPFDNPQFLAEHDGRVVVVCSGVIDASGNAIEADGGGLVLFDGNEARIMAEQPMPDFGAASAVSFDGALWVSSLTAPRVARVSGRDLEIQDVFTLNDQKVDSVFRLFLLPGGLIGAPSFNTDRIHFIDPVTGMLDGPPFYGPIAVGPGRPVFDGLQVVGVRAGRRGVDFTGPDLFALAGIASRIVPIELRKVLGP